MRFGVGCMSKAFDLRGVQVVRLLSILTIGLNKPQMNFMTDEICLLYKPGFIVHQTTEYTFIC